MTPTDLRFAARLDASVPRHVRQGPAARSTWLWAWLLALVWAAATGAARAGDVPGELPAFVGSLRTVQGDVRWYDRDHAVWLGTPQQPLRNWPLAAGDRLRTGADGRAELRIGSTTVRLGANTDLALHRLDEDGLVLYLQSGTLALRLADQPSSDDASTELHTAEGRWLPQQPGHYRFDRQQAGNRTPSSVAATQASNWRGELRFEGRDSALNIPAGRRADLWFDPASGVTRYAWASVDRDGFADWVARAERLDDAPTTARHVAPGMTGWQDLDRHGDWLSHPEIGEVWQPRVVAAGWAPFQDGRWAWVAPWGWTWIDTAPWGFAPFHYGKWVMWQNRWCWAPGPRQHRPRYAPALSAWIGGPTLGGAVVIGGRPPPPRVIAPVVIVLPRIGGHDRHQGHTRPGQPERGEARDEPRHDRHGDRRDDRREERREERRDERRDTRPVVVAPLPAVMGPVVPERPGRSVAATAPITPNTPTTPTTPITSVTAAPPAGPPKPEAPPVARPVEPPPVTVPAAPIRPVREAEPRREAREPREKTEERRLPEPPRADAAPGRQWRERQDRPDRSMSR